MKEQEILQQISQDYLERIKQTLPSQRAQCLFIVGIIGLIGSGKTAIARMLQKKLSGGVLVKSDSARFLLSEAGLGYDKVTEVIYPVAKWLLHNGHSIIFDGDYVNDEKRDRLQKFANEHGAKLYFIRIAPNKKLSLKRLQKRWEEIESRVIKQSFDNFLVVTRGKEDNLFRRVSLHNQLQDKDISNLIGVIDNINGLDNLEKQVDTLVEKIKSYAGLV